jgi:hypothetical protein
MSESSQISLEHHQRLSEAVLGDGSQYNSDNERSNGIAPFPEVESGRPGEHHYPDVDEVIPDAVDSKEADDANERHE